MDNKIIPEKSNVIKCECKDNNLQYLLAGAGLVFLSQYLQKLNTSQVTTLVNQQQEQINKLTEFNSDTLNNQLTNNSNQSMNNEIIKRPQFNKNNFQLHRPTDKLEIEEENKKRQRFFGMD